MTSTELATELAAIGHKITAEVVKKDWQKGAPRNSAEAYLAWRGKRSDQTARGDPELRRLRGEKLKGEIAVLRERKVAQKRENAVAAGELISRAWMAERIHIAAGRVDTFRHRSEAEDPLKFAAAAGDTSECRVVIKKIWDEIMASMNSLKSDFKEPESKPTNQTT